VHDRPVTPPGTLPDRQEFFRRWGAAHGGADPAATPFVTGWLTVVHALARPLAARGLPPDALTLAGLGAALAVLAPAAAGGRWLLLAPVGVVVSGLLDGLDGAVAVLSRRTRAWGAVLDALADRVADAGWCVALWLAGAPGWLAVAAGATGWLHEYVRARATAAGMGEVGVITVAERPTRIVVATLFLLGAGLYPAAAAGWSTAGAAATATTGVAGLVQLLVVVRRRLA
jgi:phosphatidylglycerophosphate synthase